VVTVSTSSSELSSELESDSSWGLQQDSSAIIGSSSQHSDDTLSPQQFVGLMLSCETQQFDIFNSQLQEPLMQTQPTSPQSQTTTGLQMHAPSKQQHSASPQSHFFGSQIHTPSTHSQEGEHLQFYFSPSDSTMIDSVSAT
jgi:hypothetical protein